MSRPYKPETLLELANEAGQFSSAHFLNGERRTAELLHKVEKALRYSAKLLREREETKP